MALKEVGQRIKMVGEATQMRIGKYEAKSWSAGIWRHQPTELHDTGYRKSAFSRLSQESSLHSFPICARLWKHSKRRTKTYNIETGLLLHKPWIIVPSSGENTGSFCITINPTNSSDQSHPRWNLQWCKSGQECIGPLCDKDVCAWKPPWQGLDGTLLDITGTCIKWKSRLEKKLVFGQLRMPESATHHTRTNSTVLWKTKWQNSTRVAMKKVVRVKVLWKKKAT